MAHSLPLPGQLLVGETSQHLERLLEGLPCYHQTGIAHQTPKGMESHTATEFCQLVTVLM